MIGEGGMGTVWRGEHLHLRAPVAVKMLTPSMRQQPQAIERFWREARLMGGLGHPNIVRVLDVSAPDAAMPYLVMELLEGESVREWMARHGTVEPSAAIQLLDGVLAALGTAHHRGIVHRDIKPENLFLAKQQGTEEAAAVKVLDFGISKLVDNNIEPSMTRTGAFVGTPHYMSPEQAAGATVDHRSDLYTVAVVLYELLSGKLPHEAENLPQLLYQRSSVEPTPIHRWVPKLHPQYHEFLATALARAPSERFQDADSMREALGKLPIERKNVDGSPDVETEAYLSALNEVIVSSESGVSLNSPPRSPTEESSADLKIDDSPPPATATPGEVFTPPVADLKPLELAVTHQQRQDTSSRPHAQVPGAKRETPKILWLLSAIAIVVVAVVPAAAVWKIREIQRIKPFRDELRRAEQDPIGVKVGRLRKPKAIRREMARANRLIVRDAAISWIGFAGLGIGIWMISGRRRTWS